MAFAVAVLAVLGSPSTAHAAVIDGAITGITITTSGDVHNNSTVDFACTWAVPTTAEPGDTFTLQLPPELSWNGSTTFPLMAPDGTTAVAIGSVDDSGLVTFTLTDYLASHDGASGRCTFQTTYHASGAGGHDLTFGVGTEVIRIPVTEGEPGTPCTADCGVKAATKWGWWTDSSAQDRIQYLMLAPVTEDVVQTLEFADAPGDGIALDCATVVSRVSATVNSDAYPAAPLSGDYRADASPPYASGQALAAPVVTCSPTALTVQWSDVPVGQYAVVEVQATVTDPTMSSYVNTGTIRVNGTDQPVHQEAQHAIPGGDGRGPAIHLEKWSTADGGPATVDGSDFSGDFDAAPGKPVAAGEPMDITLTITNTGDEDLMGLSVTDETTAGPAMAGLTCDFSALGGPSTGTTWESGPFQPGDSFTCTGTIPGLEFGATHANDAAVVATGTGAGAQLRSHDTWNATAPAAPIAVTPTAAPAPNAPPPAAPAPLITAEPAPALAVTGAAVAHVTWASVAVVILGVALMLLARRPSR